MSATHLLKKKVAMSDITIDLMDQVIAAEDDPCPATIAAAARGCGKTLRAAIDAIECLSEIPSMKGLKLFLKAEDLEGIQGVLTDAILATEILGE